MTEGAMDGPGRSTPTPDQKVEKITPEGLPHFYVNNVGLRMSIWDFVLDFGIILEADVDKLTFRDVATIVMSPQHAKAFAKVLTRHIKGYEDQFGRIPLPPDFDEKLGESAHE